MSASRAVCTIVAKNYIASARVLLQSVVEHNPDVKCFVLVIDDIDGFLDPALEPFTVLKLSDLNIPHARRWSFKYNVIELATGVKPTLMQLILAKHGVDELLYLDPDILVTAPLDKLYGRLIDSDIVVTPHLDTDYPEDGRVPDDGAILRHGIFNLGFVGVNSSLNAVRFLSWWESKLSLRCVMEAERGYYVDQRYFDMAFSFFDRIGIERGLGYNVAFWNLHSRTVGRAADGWTVNGERLYFYHFSNYKPEKPDVLASGMTRFHIADRPDVKGLFEHYRKLLLDAKYSETRPWPYTFAKFATGEIIPEGTRRFYRGVPERWDAMGDPFTSESLKKHARRDAWVAKAKRVRSRVNVRKLFVDG